MSDPEQNHSPEAKSVHTCPECAWEALVPTDAIEVDEWHFAVTQACPNCEWEGIGIFDDAQLEVYDRALDASTAEMVNAARDLKLEREERMIQEFGAALLHDEISPEDFGRPD